MRDDRFTILTCDPGPEIAALHDRQVVIVPPADWAEWLTAERPRAALMAPLPAGQIVVAPAGS